MGHYYSNDPLADARIQRSHDKWVTDDTEWQRRAAREEDEENEEDEEDDDNN